MKVSVIIVNYNYGRYIGDAIGSVLKQVHEDLELIIVDDGSTDDSRSVIEQYSGSDNRVKAVYKSNGGQMSAFNAGMKNISGDIVCFLDSDDIYKPDYLAVLVGVYNSNPECDFVITATQEFSDSDEIAIPFGVKETTDLGYTALLTLTSSFWVGDKTSSLSIRAKKAKRLFPLPFEGEWYCSTDLMLADFASIAMFRKFCIERPLVGYRLHSDNDHIRNSVFNNGYFYAMRRNRAKSHARRHYSYQDFPCTRDFLARDLEREARTGEKPPIILEAYKKAIKYCNAPWLSRYKYSRRVGRLMKRAGN